jgi:diguanylate cyclase (GGDEF)-like protein
VTRPEGGPTPVVALRPPTEQHFQAMLASVDHGVMVLGRDGSYQSANPAAARILGIPDGCASSLAAVHLYDEHGHAITLDQSPVGQTLRTGMPVVDCLCGLDRLDGQRVWLLCGTRLLEPDDPQHSAVLVSFSDVTRLRTAYERVTHEATHDSLTGLPNRAHIVDKVAQALKSGNSRKLAAVLFIDLDHLKLVNDSLGHDAGDDVIRMAAQRLRRNVRSEDVVARLGGDEFVVLLVAQIARPNLEELADRIHAALAEPVVIGGVTLRIGASIGIVVVGCNDRRDAAEILRDADIAMYQAKTRGGGRTHHFTAGRNDGRPPRFTTGRDPLNGTRRTTR